MPAVLNIKRMDEIDAVLGPDQRATLLSSLAAQAAGVRAALREYHGGDDSRQLLRTVHRLKGAAQIVGADDLIAALIAIERSPPGAVDAKLLDTADARIVALIDAIAAYSR